jgi:hypothetical protein
VTEKPGEPPAPRSGCGAALLGCGVVRLVGIAAFGHGSWRASRSLDARAAALAEEIAALRDGATTRAVPHEVATPGNAADEHLAAVWLLGPDPQATRPPALPASAPRGDPDAIFERVLKPVDAALADLDAGGAPSPAALALLRDHAAAIQRVRDGVRRERCDWGVRYEDGSAHALPNLVAVRVAAKLLALSAAAEPDPTEAARRCLDVLAFGRDLEAGATMLHVMVGSAVKVDGAHALERLLRARGLPRAAYEEALASLAVTGPTDLALGLAGERLLLQAELAHLASRGLSLRVAPADSGGYGGALLVQYGGPMLLDREWGGAADALLRAQQVAALPRAQRAAAQQAFEAELASSWLIVAALAVPDATSAAEAIDRQEALVQALRLLVAAHLHRLDAGDFPADAAPLARYLGGALPVDPFRADGGPLTLRVVDGEARAWSVGENGVDDGGAGHHAKTLGGRKDEVLVTSRPKVE